MKLLFDQNLSRRLVGLLADIFPDSSHVALVGLDTASDSEIWAYAGEHDYVIASKDSDFGQLAFLHGPPPKAVWLRVGNQPTKPIADLLRTNATIIADFVESENEAILVLPDLRPLPSAANTALNTQRTLAGVKPRF